MKIVLSIAILLLLVFFVIFGQPRVQANDLPPLSTQNITSGETLLKLNNSPVSGSSAHLSFPQKNSRSN